MCHLSFWAWVVTQWDLLQFRTLTCRRTQVACSERTHLLEEPMTRSLHTDPPLTPKLLLPAHLEPVLATQLLRGPSSPLPFPLFFSSVLPSSFASALPFSPLFTLYRLLSSCPEVNHCSPRWSRLTFAIATVESAGYGLRLLKPQVKSDLLPLKFFSYPSLPCMYVRWKCFGIKLIQGYGSIFPLTYCIISLAALTALGV